MSYQTRIQPSASREIRGLPGNVRAQAMEIIRSLGSDPRPARAKELRGLSDVYRMWLAGHWRIVYRVEEAQQVVRLLRVRRKEQIDYESLGPPVAPEA